jgi:integrase
VRAHFRQRPNGSWEGREQVAGRRVSVYGKTESEARRKLRDAVRTLEQGQRLPDHRRTTATWLESWLTTDVRPNLRPATVRSYEGIVKRHLVPELGRIPVAKLSEDDVARMLASASHLSVRTRRYALSLLRTSLQRALERGVVARNVAKLVKPPKDDKRERHPFTPAQMAALIDATADDRIGPLVVLSATTGLRQGEALGLRWDDVELDAGALTVRHTLTPHTRQLAPTKTDRSRRTVHLPPRTVAALREQRRRQLEDRLRAGRRWNDEGYVFTTAVGTAMDARDVDRRYHAARVRLGLHNVPWHYLRHFAATALLEAGEDLFVVSRILGHTSVATTASFYGHVQPAMLRASADRMEELMRKASGT